MTYGIMSDEYDITLLEFDNPKDALLEYAFQNTNVLDEKLRNAIRKDNEYTYEDVISFINANAYCGNNIMQVFEVGKTLYDGF